MKDVNSRNQFWLDLRTEEGRAQLSVDLSSLSHRERLFLYDIMHSANTGSTIAFGVGEDDKGAHVMQFTIARPTPAQLDPTDGDHAVQH